MTEWGSTPTVVAPRGVGQLRQGMGNGEEFVIFEEWIRCLLSRSPQAPLHFFAHSACSRMPMRLMLMLNCRRRHVTFATQVGPNGSGRTS